MKTRTRLVVGVVAIALGVAACATSKQKKARSGVGRLKAGMAESQIEKLAGQPMGVEGSGGVQRYWYETRSVPMPPVCSVVDVKTGQVTGVYEDTPCPVPLYAQDKPERSAMRGGVRLGMTRAEVEKKMGAPPVVTANEGIETLYYPNKPTLIVRPGTPPYGRVDIGHDGKVVAFTDVFPRPEVMDDELPTTREKDVAVKKVRVGMDEATVVEKMGKPNDRREENGLVILRYQVKTLGQPIVTDQVELKDGRVFSLRQYDHRASHWFGASKTQRAEREAMREQRRKAAAAAAAVILLDAAAKDSARRNSSGGSEGGGSAPSVPVQRSHTTSCSQTCAEYKEINQYQECLSRCRARGGK